MEETIKIAVVTVSTRCSRGQAEDTSGPALCGLLKQRGYGIVRYSVVGDDRAAIGKELIDLSDRTDAAVVFTLGGTGLAPDDVTPEATEDVIERRIPGIPEALRAAGLMITPRAMLSRGTAGIRNNTIIINMPGSEKAVTENAGTIFPVIEHAVALVLGKVGDCGRSTDD